MEATVSQRIAGRVDSQYLTPAEGRLIKEYLVEMQSLNGSGDRSVISQMYRFITLAKIFHSGDSTLDTAGTYDHLAAVAAIRGRPDLSPEYRKMHQRREDKIYQNAGHAKEKEGPRRDALQR